MKNRSSDSRDKSKELHRRAEELIRSSSETASRPPPDQLPDILNELQVYQAELEIQNEELRNAQESLEMARDLYFDLYDLAPVGYLSVSETGLIKRANLTAAEMLGLPRRQLINTALSFYIIDRHQARYTRYRQKVKLGNQKEICELSFNPVTGGRFHAQMECVPEMDEEGNFFACRTVLVDITQRKEAEAALKKSEAKYASLFRSSPLWVSLTTLKDGTFIEVNDSFSKISGYSRGEVLGRTALQIGLWTDPTLRQEAMDTIAKQGKLVDYHIDIITKDGQLRHLLWSGEILEYEGQPCLVSIFRDITERKKAEQERDRLENQLRQSQKLEALSTLSGGIAHDFNNILAAIMGYSELALESLPDGSDSAEDLKQVIKAGYRGKNLVRQILSFSRVEIQQEAPVQISELIGESLKLLRPAIPTTIEIEENLSDTQDYILVDPVQIQQLILNLCTNAFHAMEENGGLLKVSLSSVDLGSDELAENSDLKLGKYQRLVIRDTGIGMDEHVLNRAFEPFFTTKDVSQGTGMGLSVVHGIVRSHDGDISAASQPGQGSVLTVLLPVFSGRAPDKAAGERALPIGGRESILLVDDEPDLVATGSQRLQRLGYRVAAFTSSSQALEAFEKNPDAFDLVITDYTMPNMTGATLAQEIKALRPEIPIIITTGFSQQLTPEKIKSLGIKRLIMKPLAGEKFARVVREVLDDRA